MSLSIWYISKYVCPPGRGTVGVRGYTLMSEISKLGHQVSIITSDSNHLTDAPSLNTNYLFQQSDGLHLCWVRTLKYISTRSLRRILSWIHFEWRLLFLPRSSLTRPDIIIVSSLSLLTIISGLFFRLLYNSTLIFEVRDIWPLTAIEDGGYSSSNPFIVFLSLFEYIAYKFSHAVVGTMPNLSQHVESVLGQKKETYCIPMGIDPYVLSSSSQLPPGYLTTFFPSGKFIVGHVGSIGTTNALETFFHCANLMSHNKIFHFLLIGDGDLRDYYKQKYSHLSNISFAPKVPKQMVQDALHNCDVLYFSVYKSRVWQFGQSLNKVIDYMLSGKPIVASYSGFPSMINEARCGSFVPAGDAEALRNELLHYFSIGDTERSIIGSRGRSWLLENRQYSKLASNYLDILSHVHNRRFPK